MEQVLILVDVQNVYYTCRQAFNKNFDYNEFWRQVTKDREVINAFAYAIDRGDQKQKEFQNILRAIGFNVRLKPFIQRNDGTSKGDWDVGITIDAMENGREVDTVVLVSGDGDFGVLVDKLKVDWGKKVEVYGVKQLTAESLIGKASKYIPIEYDLLLP